MRMDRRTFIGRSVGLVTVSALVPRFGVAGARFFEESIEAPPDRVLVVLELAGGNDGLNTVIPYTDPLYLTHRARVGVPAAGVLAHDGLLCSIGDDLSKSSGTAASGGRPGSVVSQP